MAHSDPEYQKKYRGKNRDALLKKQRESYIRHRAHRLATAKAYAVKNATVVREKAIARWAKTPDRVKRGIGLRKYGLSLEQYEQMLAQQKGRCAVCQEVPRRICVDHDHETGDVRGLLCSSCNTALGLLKEDLLRISALADYIRER